MRSRSHLWLVIIFAVQIGLFCACRDAVEHRDVRPLVMHDVPAQRLAYRLEADSGLPQEFKLAETEEKAALVQTDFNDNRKDDALLRTVTSPDGRRILALYGTADEPSEAFRIDMYADDGKFLRKVTAPQMSCAFPDAVAWSPDGNSIAF